MLETLKPLEEKTKHFIEKLTHSRVNFQILLLLEVDVKENWNSNSRPLTLAFKSLNPNFAQLNSNSNNTKMLHHQLLLHVLIKIVAIKWFTHNIPHLHHVMEAQADQMLAMEPPAAVEAEINQAMELLLDTETLQLAELELQVLQALPVLTKQAEQAVLMELQILPHQEPE